MERCSRVGIVRVGGEERWAIAFFCVSVPRIYSAKGREHSGCDSTSVKVSGFFMNTHISGAGAPEPSNLRVTNLVHNAIVRKILSRKIHAEV